ncbi:hypothetical protein QOZ80_1AG0013520 [Eleusine coracana subsp. coracana]|nr:hypothetical protein QOZ80_1AG0013520 [Eleusine coracana subsp. coracana]
MDCKKVNLQWIANDSTHQSTFKKRSNALMKKANELVTLCGVKVSVVVYGENEAKPVVYPSIPEATQLLNNFKAMPDDLANFKKVVNQEEYLRGRISKLKEQMGRCHSIKHKDQTSHLLHAALAGQGPGLSSLTIEELVNLNWMVEKKMRDAKARLEQIDEQRPFEEPPAPPQEQPTLPSQLQAPNTCTEMQTLAPTEETQPEQQNLLADLAWSEWDDFDLMVYTDVGIMNDDAGPSTSGGDIMQDYDMEGPEFLWSWDPFTDNME